MPYDFSNHLDRTGTASLKWTQYPKDVLPVWVADTDFAAPDQILDALKNRLDHGVLGYEFPQASLLKAVADRMIKLYGWQVEPEAVVATPGIIAAFNAAAWTVGQPGQGLLTQPPVYPPFLALAGNVGLVNQFAQLRAETHEHVLNYRIDFDDFRGALHSNGARTAMFLLCNPHNPTGQIYTRAELQRVAELCLEHEVAIVSDEIHSELLLGEARHIPIASLSPEIERRTITLVAPSKTYNVPGLFCGFAIIPDAALRERFKKASDRLIHHVSSLSLIAAEVAYSGECDAWLAALRRQLAANRDWVVDFVRRNLPEVRITVPQATYLAWLDCNRLPLNGRNPYEFFLEHAKVAFNRGEDFGAGGEGFVRLNFGTTPQMLEEAMERVKRSHAAIG
jgi:cysteine-S-conjugate beta-lyase